MVFWTSLDTPIPVRLASTVKGICRLSFTREPEFVWELRQQFGEAERNANGPFLEEAAKQLRSYFALNRRDFDVPLELRGTKFQVDVWQGLRTIGYGETCSYADVAGRIGRPGAARAVGQANHNNPVAIIVPCHRVIAADGTLGGFGTELSTKEKLLQLEGASFRSTPASVARFQLRSRLRARRAAGER
jgi:methylated-DNA-[protein]-cysteine S-methyltransferase